MFERLQHGAYQDGIKFVNGKELSLQLLGAGVTIMLAPLQKRQEALREHEKTLEPIA